MRSHAHTTTWGTHIGVGRASDAKGCYDHLKHWWAARKAMRRDGPALGHPGFLWKARTRATLTERR